MRERFSFLAVFGSMVLGCAQGGAVDEATASPSEGSRAPASQGSLVAPLAPEAPNPGSGQSPPAPEGQVATSLVAMTPTGPLAAGIEYHVTLRLFDYLTSSCRTMPCSQTMRFAARAGAGWHVTMLDQPSAETEMLVADGATKDVTLVLSADSGAADSALEMVFYPELAPTLAAFSHPVPLALGQEPVPNGTAAAYLNYVGAPLGEKNEIVLAKTIGVIEIPFWVGNLSTTNEDYVLSLEPQGTATGWTPILPVLVSSMAGSTSQKVSLFVATLDKTSAQPTVTYRAQLSRVVGLGMEPLPYTTFDVTLDLR